MYDGQTTADFHDPAILSARLTRTDDGAPISGETIAFAMGAESCAPSTASSGEAACLIVPRSPRARHGDRPASPATATTCRLHRQPFAVTREETTTVFTGPTVILQGHPVTLCARLAGGRDTPIAVEC